MIERIALGYSVCNLSKNTIWKQITTGGSASSGNLILYAIYQRTQSESKSQPGFTFWRGIMVCMQSIKEHNLKANHNNGITAKASGFSVCNLSKNTIWKQITTKNEFPIRSIGLYAIYQRTQSESKSQHTLPKALSRYFCMQSIKEHNLKANHNSHCWNSFWRSSVCNLSKNTIWKQITTITRCFGYWVILYAIYQRTQSESKSQQPQLTHPSSNICMQSIKEHNLKANHNRG